MSNKKTLKMKMSINLYGIKYGLLMVAVGIAFLFFGPIPIWGQYIEKELGILFILLGVGFFIITFFSRKKYQKLVSEKKICPNCGKVYNKLDVSVDICPKCSVKLNEFLQI